MANSLLTCVVEELIDTRNKKNNKHQHVENSDFYFFGGPKRTKSEPVTGRIAPVDEGKLDCTYLCKECLVKMSYLLTSAASAAEVVVDVGGQTSTPTMDMYNTCKQPN
eukprot:6275585-Amphidinium_carterae.1